MKELASSLELNQEKIADEGFSSYLKNPIDLSACTNNILSILPHEIRNFTFVRFYRNGDFSIVSPRPFRSYKYVKYGFWRHDIAVNVDYSLPIYNRTDYLPEDLHIPYKRFLSDIGGKSCIVTSYRFGQFKDTFMFVFADEITKKDYLDIYAMLHNVAISFYHLEIECDTNFKLPKSFYDQYAYQNDNYIFDSFADFVEERHLTKTKASYLLPLALNMPLDYMASLFCKSRRTVEKNIDEIRESLNVSSKFELCQLLNAYHIMKVQKSFHTFPYMSERV